MPKPIDIDGSDPEKKRNSHMTQSTSHLDRLPETVEDYADDANFFRRRASRVLESQREAAQGVEVFEDPDAIIPRSDLIQGPLGEESLVGDDSTDEDELREEVFEDRW